MKKPIIEILYDSQFTQIIIALIINAFYASVLGISLLPSVWITVRAAGATEIARNAHPLAIVAFSLALGAAVFAYFLWGAIFQALMIRLISFGVKPGRYPKVSATTVRWLIYSGIFNIAMNSILPFIPVSWFSIAFFRIVGARIGKNVYINTRYLNDAYLMTIEDGVVIDGNAEISCHLMEKDWLHLEPVKIGKGTLIGTGAYIPPGTAIGERCTIGARCYLRKGTRVSDGSVLTVVAGIPMRDAFTIEKRTARKTG